MRMETSKVFEGLEEIHSSITGEVQNESDLCHSNPPVNHNNNNNTNMGRSPNGHCSDGQQQQQPNCGDFRTLTDPQIYHQLNHGSSVPNGHHNTYAQQVSYAMLTPLQPLPPISTVKPLDQQQFQPQPGHQANHNGQFGGFAQLSHTHPSAQQFAMAHQTYQPQTQMLKNYTDYGELKVPQQHLLQSSQQYPMVNMVHLSQPHQIQIPPHSQHPNMPYGYQRPVELRQFKQENPNSYNGYEQYQNARLLQSPMINSSPPSGNRDAKMPQSTKGSPSSNGDLEEINTKELAQRISAELKRYSIPQAIFAQRVLCRSQGTLSDLLRNPKPWSKLKSGRETFRRMWKWLQEPEFQRMSSLRLAGE